jgi:1-acyl-sn-glycerol-3-phosphate acyltransferase
MLWLSNHISWIDIPLLGMLAPLSFLSKSEVRGWPVAGWLAQQAGTLFLRRGAGDSGALSQQMAERLRNGHPLLLFPEGTTSDGSRLRTFHGRLLSCAIETGVPLQPVAIRYLREGQRCNIAPFVGEEDLFSHLLRLLRSDIGEVQICLLAPIDSQSSRRNQLARRAEEAISGALFGDAEPDQVAA